MFTDAWNLSVRDAAKRLGVSISKLYQLAAAKKIGHYRIGGKILFSPQDVESFLTGCRVGVAAAPVATTRLSRPRLKHVRLK